MNQSEGVSKLIDIHLEDGAKNTIEAFYAAEPSAAVLIIFPAMGVKASYYKTFAKNVARDGMHVVTADHRGQGRSGILPSRKTDYGYKEQVEIEYNAIVETAKAHFPGSKIFIMGHSLGGQMGAMFVSMRNDIAGLILNASCSVYYKGWEGASSAGVLIGSRFSKAVSILVGYFPGHKLGFGGKQSRGIIADWAHTARTGKFKAKGSAVDYEEALKNTKVPVLALSYEGDAAAPHKSVKNLVDKFVSSNVKHHHFKHEASGKKYDHYSWIRNPELSMPVIREWISNILNDQ